MKCLVNWIPLRIRVRSRNTQPTTLIGSPPTSNSMLIILKRASLGHDQGNFLTLQCFPLGYKRFHSKGSQEVAMKRRD